MKTLISVKEIEDAKKEGKTVLYYNCENTLITPSARDYADQYGICLKEGCGCGCGCDEPVPQSTATNDCAGVIPTNTECDLIYHGLKQLMEANKLDSSILASIMADIPFISESDDYGNVKIVRGNTAKWEPLDTGNPNDKVFFNELIGAADNSTVNLGFMTIENCEFPWEVSCEEFFYVVEGALSVVSGSQKMIANPGDVLAFKKGANLSFGSPNKVKVFYATH